MGLPQNQSQQTEQPGQSTNPSTTQEDAPKSASDLPPEALDLATKLFDLARTGATTSLTPYLTAGIPPNLTNHNGDTLLMLAAYHGHLPTVRLLLSHGADPDVLNARGQSIIAGAVFKGEEEVVRCLMEEGKADLGLGQPSAREAAVMFRRVGVLRIFGMEDKAREVEASQPGSS